MMLLHFLEVGILPLVYADTGTNYHDQKNEGVQLCTAQQGSFGGFVSGWDHCFAAVVFGGVCLLFSEVI
jgi:hypothetical protein